MLALKILYYFLTLLIVVLLLCYNNFIDNKRIFIYDNCDINYFFLHLHDYYICNKTCYYKGQESDDCPAIDPIICAVSIIVVLFYCMLPFSTTDIYFFHYIIQLGFWYCAFKYDYNTLTIETLIVNKAVYLGYVAPLLHIIYEKQFKGFLENNDMVAMYFFIPYWIFGINLDTFNKIFGLELSLTSNFKTNTRTIGLFIVLTLLLTIHQTINIYRHGKLKRSIIYISIITAFVLPFLIIGMKIHIHHYLFALFVMPLIYGTQNDIITLSLTGAMVGTFINGVVVWGPDTLFYK